MLIHLFTLCSLVISVVLGQLISPCPNVLTYEPRNKDESDRWHANVSISSVDGLEGIWLRIKLDRAADILGNWFGEIQSRDNIEYIIKNPSYKLEADAVLTVRFFVKYNAASTVPTVNRILLNGKIICPANTRAQPQLDTSLSNLSSAIRTESSSVPNPNTISGNTRTNNFIPPDISIIDRPISFQPPKPPCGTIANQPTPLIRFGQRTAPGEWPWHAALYHSNGLELLYICGGTLISENYVLTAAHCVTRPRTTRVTNQQNLLVYLGKYNLRSFGAEVQDRKVEDIIVHPKFDPTLFYNDIAILRLNKPAEITDYVRICCLWAGPNNDLQSVIGQLGTVVGWGFDETKTLSTNLIQTKMPIIPTDQCIFSNRNFFSQFIFEKNYCAGFRNGTSVCNGDSGGAMVFPKQGISGRQTVWEVRGIVSVSIALQGEGTCDPKNYMIFTDVAKHLDWIKETTNL